MLFNSAQYALFFVAVFTLHWLLPVSWRRPFLLVASLYFYASAIPQYLILILALIIVNFVFALWIHRLRGRMRTAALWLALLCNLGSLAYFKYSQFIVNAAQGVVQALPLSLLLPPITLDPIVLNILLPLGISFFTFEFIHYIVEVYKGMPATRNPVDFALFAAFFPTQIAGPIKRFPDWIKQLAHPAKLREIDVDGGIGLVLRGLVKKVIIADTLAAPVAIMFGTPGTLGAGAAWFAVFAFAVQIYCDFSGYTDIGRGCAQLLGYQVPLNFNGPYQSKSPSEFWRRWHMSLSSWLRDYLYIPLGGSRVSRWRVYLNLMITMALGGLWHGASWHFMIWGVYQGALLCVDRVWGRTIGAAALYRRMMSIPVVGIVRYPVTLLLVCVGWVFFRAAGITPALMMLRSMFAFDRPLSLNIAPNVRTPLLMLALAGVIVASGWGRSLIGGRLGDLFMAARERVVDRWWRPVYVTVLRSSAYAFLALILIVWPTHAAQPFIYFQF